nr:MAG TPA: hypothetical protein [Bacteriophage sp.]
MGVAIRPQRQQMEHRRGEGVYKIAQYAAT